MLNPNIDVSTLGSERNQGTDYLPGEWMKEPPPPRPSLCIWAGSGDPNTHFQIDGKEVAEEEYRAVDNALRESDITARRQKEFISVDEAFAYADSLSDGVVLDWGRCYAAMERDGLKIGFVIEPYEQPIVAPEDLLTRAGPYSIVARRVGERGCSTCFSDESQSYSDSTYEVIDDGTGRYERGQRLLTRVVPNEGARPSVGRNWRMKILKPEDVQAVLAANTQETKTPASGASRSRSSREFFSSFPKQKEKPAYATTDLS